MTVSELIEELKKYDGGMKVCVVDDCGDPVEAGALRGMKPWRSEVEVLVLDW